VVFIIPIIALRGEHAFFSTYELENSKIYAVEKKV
jgi:hypothetical protein